MKILNLILFAFFTFNYSISQDHLVGVQFGKNLTSASAVNSPGQVPRDGISAGVSYEYVSKKKLSTEASLIYTQRGYKTGLPYMNEFGELADKNYKNNHNFDYISLPLKVGFKFGNKFFGLMNMGIVPAYLIQAQTVMPGFNDGEITKIQLTRQYNKFDVAGLVELGGGYKIQNRFVIFITTAYQHSFTTTSNLIYPAQNKMFHFGLTFSTGIKVKLGE